MKQFWFRVFCGVFWAASVFAPGFSGSIIAITMGIYPDLIRIAANPLKNFKANVQFMFPLLIGGIICAVLFVLLMNFLLLEFGESTYMLFVGLVLGNLTTVGGDLMKNGFKKRYVVGALSALAITLCIGRVGLFFRVGEGGAWSLTAGGFAGGVASLVPGVSVSMIMIMMGAYDQLIFVANALLHADFSMLFGGVVFLGAFGVGMITASNAIKYAFDNHPKTANSVVFGFLLGSLVGILWSCIDSVGAGFNWLEGTLMCAIGVSVSMVLVEIGKKVKA